MDIVRDDADRWRFLKLLRYLNDENIPRNWERSIGPDHIRAGFARPVSWGKQAPYVSILAYCLMDNHFHLLLRENKEGGISKFMQRVGTSMSAYFNAKHGETGTLFQGAYQARTITSDRQLQYLAAYIHIKNPLERYPGGVARAVREFDVAYEWVKQDPFSGHGHKNISAILDVILAKDVLQGEKLFKTFAKDVLLGRLGIDDERVLVDG